MTEADKIARFLAENGARRCPPAWAAPTSNALPTPPDPPPKPASSRARRGLGKRRRQDWAYKL